jgi:hypothetical protein
LDGGGIRFGGDPGGTSLNLDGVLVSGNQAAFGGGLRIDHHFSATVDVVGSTFIGNQAWRGAGIDVEGRAGITLSDSTIQDCVSSGFGGGLAVVDSDAELTNVLVHGCTAVEGGAGVHAEDDAELTLLQVTIEGNQVTGPGPGGGLNLDEASLLAEGLALLGNSAGGNGGGAAFRQSDVLLSGARVVANSAGDDGGGIWANDGTILVDHLLAAGNVAGVDGGGWSQWASTTTIEQAVFAGNECGGDGGGLYYSGGGMTLGQAAVVGNTAGESGGGIRQSAWGLLVHSTIVTGNTAGDSGGGVDGSTGFDLLRTDLWGNAPDDWDLSTDPIGSDGNVSADPAFLDLAGVDPLGWDLHLTAGSPVIGAGDPLLVDPDGSPTDLGPYGGPGADGWDLDFDGAPAWWQPGPYDSAAYPSAGWDCDDLSATVGPSSGC